MVVPVLVALGSGTPWAWRAALRLWLEKSKPAMVCRGRCAARRGVLLYSLQASQRNAER